MADKPKLSEEQIKQLKQVLDVTGPKGETDGKVRMPDLNKIAGKDGKIQRTELNALIKDKPAAEKDAIKAAFEKVMGGKGDKEIEVKDLAAKLRDAGVMEPAEKGGEGPGNTPKNKDKGKEEDKNKKGGGGKGH